MSSIFEEFDNMDTDLQDVDESNVIDATNEEALYDAMCGLAIDEATEEEHDSDDDTYDGWD